MKFTWKEDGRRIILIVVAAAISAVNIKSFVRTGGLYPGGVTDILRFGVLWLAAQRKYLFLKKKM